MLCSARQTYKALLLGLSEECRRHKYHPNTQSWFLAFARLVLRDVENSYIFSLTFIFKPDYTLNTGFSLFLFFDLFQMRSNKPLVVDRPSSSPLLS